MGHEGGYSNDPLDSGKATRYGITERVARANGYQGDMRDLPLERAQDIARTQYWDVLRLDAIAELSAEIAAELFDTSYNCGTGRAGQFLQRALNALNRGEADYPDLVVDGLVGPMTVAALRVFIGKRGDAGRTVMLRALNCLQGAFYVELAERKESQERFVYGWLLNRLTEITTAA